MAKRNDVRFELFCGQLKTDPTPEDRELYEFRRAQHVAAAEVARRLKVRSYFEEHQERGWWHLDGYVYAPASRAVEVLQAFKDAGVEVDIADVPDDPDLIARLEVMEWVQQFEVG